VNFHQSATCGGFLGSALALFGDMATSARSNATNGQQRFAPSGYCTLAERDVRVPL
jgi:hypothetical protein